MVWPVKIKLIRGITREVLIVGRLVFKMPSFRSYRLFLTGLLANLQEKTWWKETKDSRLCPVVASLPFGLLIVMPFAKPIGQQINFVGNIDVTFTSFYGLPLDPKSENFGIYKDKMVLIDYGN